MSAPSTLELKRHFHTLPEGEIDEVIDLVAGLIVSFLKTRSGYVTPMHGRQSDAEMAECKAQPSTRSGR